MLNLLIVWAGPDHDKVGFKLEAIYFEPFCLLVKEQFSGLSLW